MACISKKKWLYFSFSTYLILAIIVTFNFSIANPFNFSGIAESHSNENSDLKSYTINWTAGETVVIARARSNTSSSLRNGMIRVLAQPGINKFVVCFAESLLSTSASNYIPIKKDTIILQLRI